LPTNTQNAFNLVLVTAEPPLVRKTAKHRLYAPDMNEEERYRLLAATAKHSSFTKSVMILMAVSK